MNKFFEENHRLIFQEWIDPSELKNAKVLDLGSQTGWLGEYCVEHGAIEYVGVDIDEWHLNKAKENYPNLTFVLMDLEDYIKDCITEKKYFDIAVVSRTMQGVTNQIQMLQHLSKITNKIVLETGVPINFPAYRLLEILKDIELSEEHKKEINKIYQYIEYEYTFIESLPDERFLQLLPSIGLLKDVLEKLGFELSLNTYESVRLKYPDEYGFKIKNKDYDLINKTILKFTKVSNEQKPLTWKQYKDNGGVI